MKINTHLRIALAAVVFVVSMFIAPPSAAAQSEPEIATASGPVSGTIRGDIESWLGIPYAAPPVGALRWQPPQPVKPWTTPLKANTLSSRCAQNADLGVFASAGGTEDCLYLNVYCSRAARAGGAKLPVFVWIHGGSLWVGQGGDYDAAKLASRGKAIVVTFNYRLGTFGYFAHPEIDREGHNFANYGQMDQQAALDWVERNIAQFGGDPGNVTIAGESSGGNSVMLHVASPLSAGKFQHGIAMSGGAVVLKHPAFGSPRPLAEAEEVGVAFARAVGCETDSAACLRALPTKRILDAQTPHLINQVILDGTVLPMHPADAFRTGRINRVTLVNGNTRDEGRFFVGLPENATGKAMTAADYPRALESYYGRELAPSVMREYPLDRYDSPGEAYAAANTDSLFACPGREINRLLTGKIPVYAYEFGDGTAPSYLGPTTFPMLAAHTYELPYLFPGFRGGDGVPVRLNPLQERLSDQMVDYFANVAALQTREAEWPRYDPRRDNVMNFALPEAGVVSGRFAEFHRCGFWDRSGIY